MSKKTILLTFSLFLITITTFGQEKLKPLKVYLQMEEASKKEFYIPSRRLAYSDNNKPAEGCEAYLKLSKKNEKVVSNTFHVICAGLGCIEESTLTVLFENDEKIERKSLNSHNCEGETHFPLSKKDLELLAKFEVKNITVKNEREFNSVIGVINEEDYFIKFLDLIKENKIEAKKH